MKRGGRGPAAARRRPDGKGPAPGAAPRGAGITARRGVPWGEPAIVLACVALALWVHRRALGQFFALDDLVILEEVRGLREATPGLWRLLSRYLYFGAAVPLFGTNPLPYHLVSAALHAVNVALLYQFARGRSGSALVAGVAAGLFGASRLHFNAIGSAATIGEPLALGLTLGALQLAERDGRARLAAPFLFLCALLAKESVVLLPAVLLLPRAGGEPLRQRLLRAAPLLALGALFAVALMAGGAGETHLAGRAYARALGANVLINLMTYAKWAADQGDAFLGQVSAMDPGAWPVGAAVTAALAILAILARRAPWPPAFGGLWWLLALAPVLPLLHHTYLYYLYIPFAGVAMAVAAGVGWAERRMAGRARAALAALATVLVVAHAVNADRLLGRRFSARLPGTGVPLDPDLRKSETARHASDAVARTLAGRPARVAFLLPASLERVYSAATGERMARRSSDTLSYSILAGALDDGRGLRALHPNVDSVAFLPDWRPGHAGFELFSQSPDGTVFPLGRGPDGFAAAGAAMTRSGEVGPARELLAGALSEFPDHAPLRFQYARTFYAAGDSLGMRRELSELIRRAPDHPLADRARAALGGR